MSRPDVSLDGFKQAFEDFVAHEAEWAIAEATRDQESSKRLWIVLFGDGRYATEHLLGGDRDGTGLERLRALDPTPQIAFPIEPLAPEERSPDALEDSDFERPLEALWSAYEQALQSHALAESPR